MAVALDQRLVVVGAGGEGVEFATVVGPKESITALAWLAAPGQPTGAPCCTACSVCSGDVGELAMAARLSVHGNGGC